MFPNNANVPADVSLTFYLETDEWANNTAIDWGNVTAGTSYIYNFTALNVGNVNTTVTMQVTGLPAGWTLTWAGNNTLLEPVQAISSDLTLTVATGAGGGAYSWTLTVDGVET